MVRGTLQPAEMVRWRVLSQEPPMVQASCDGSTGAKAERECQGIEEQQGQRQKGKGCWAVRICQGRAGRRFGGRTFTLESAWDCQATTGPDQAQANAIGAPDGATRAPHVGTGGGAQGGEGQIPSWTEKSTQQENGRCCNIAWVCKLRALRGARGGGTRRME